MIVHKPTAIGPTEMAAKPDPKERSAAYWLGAWAADQDASALRYAQCGHTESQLDWVFEQLREPKVVNLNASRLSLAVSLAIRSM